MVSKSDIHWFKSSFGDQIDKKFSGSLFTLDFLTAIACQETGYIWSTLRKNGLDTDEILELCVGDTVDAPRRKAFPKNKTDLLKRKNGQAMFDIGHDSLVAMAAHIPSYRNEAKKANEFCRGYGIFQYDLQHFKTDPDYFLSKKWTQFDEVLGKLEEELEWALRVVINKKGISAGAKGPLTNQELCYIGIAYNTGNNFRSSKGLRQGYYNRSTKKYYGEHLAEWLEKSQDIDVRVGGMIAVGVGTAISSDLEYPGAAISRKSKTNGGIVRQVQARLEELDFGPVGVDGDFGMITENAVMAFQALNDDENGIALDVDGEIAELTWDALFQDRADIEDPVPDLSGIDSDSLAFIEVANAQIGVKQTKRGGPESGPMVDAYILSTGLKPSSGSYWCMAFVYWCAMKTCEERSITNHLPRTAHVKTSWNRAKADGVGKIVEKGQANATTVTPGMVFYISTGSTTGHTGIVTKVSGSNISTIEGNTNAGGSRNGYGVFARTRKIKPSNLIGYINFWDD